MDNSRLDSQGYVIPLPRIQRPVSETIPKCTTPDDGNGTTPEPNYYSSVHAQSTPYRQPLSPVRRVVVIATITILALSLVGVCGYLIWVKTSGNISSTTTTTTIPDILQRPDGEICGLACSIKSPCTVPRNTPNCTRCENAVVPIGGHILFCTQSCARYGSDVIANTNGVDICGAKNIMNVGVTELQSTCTASNATDANHACENAMTKDTDEWIASGGVGHWIELNFIREYLIIGLELWPRHSYDTQCNLLEVVFSNHLVTTVGRSCGHPAPLDQYYFPPVKTSLVRVRCVVACLSNVYFGLQHIGTLALV